MIIGEQSWQRAIANPLQRLPFLRVKSARLARRSCRAYGRAMACMRSRFGVYARRVGAVLAVEAVVALLLVVYVLNANVPAWAVVAPMLAFDYLSLIVALFYCRFKARQTKEKVGAKLIIAGTPIPRMTEAAKPPSNSASIPSLSQQQQPHSSSSSSCTNSGIFQTKVWKQTPTEPQQTIHNSTSLPVDIAGEDTIKSAKAAVDADEHEKLLPFAERFPRRRSSAKAKRKEDESEASDKENADTTRPNASSAQEKIHQNFARLLEDSTALVDAEVRRFEGANGAAGCGGKRLLQKCSVCSAQERKTSAQDQRAPLTSSSAHNPLLQQQQQQRQHRRRRETIATPSLTKSEVCGTSALDVRADADGGGVPRTTSIGDDAAQWAECQKCLRRERLTLNASRVSSPVGYDVFLSCSSSSELDWITQKALPQLQ